jgi:hypothetical protein
MYFTTVNKIFTPHMKEFLIMLSTTEKTWMHCFQYFLKVCLFSQNCNF